MEVVYKKDAVELKNIALTVHEYNMKEKDINGAIVKLSGRYPEKGRVKNLKCKEMAYVIKGSGKLVVEEKEIYLSSGDLVLIHPEEEYYWEGNFELFVPSTPAWSIDQHQTVF